MNAFKALFGIEAGSVRRTCVLLPFVHRDIRKGLGIGRLSKGLLYGAAHTDLFTVIHTRIGSAFLGDAVLYLEETGCRNVVLFGACGSAGGSGAASVGDLICPFGCGDAGNFARMLTKPSAPWSIFYADKEIHGSFMETARGRGVLDARCLSVGSLKIEETLLGFLREKGAKVFDMECASLFAAARFIRRSPLALLYVTDIVGEKPFYDIAVPERAAITSSVKKGLQLLCDFIEKRLNA